MVNLLKGITASPGVVTGKVFLLMKERFSIPQMCIVEERVPDEIARFEQAIATTMEEVTAMRQKLIQELDEEHAHILDAHLLVLEDALLIEQTKERVRKEKLNVEYVFSQVLEKLAESFSRIGDEYLRERADDVRDVGRRVLRALLGKQSRDLSKLEEEVVVIATDISPSDTALMHKEKVIGFATDVGSRTSHTAIMARSLEIPAVVGLKDITRRVKRGDTVIVDGNRGEVIISPDEKVRKQYQTREKELKEIKIELKKFKDLPAETLDGHRVILSANIELPEELPSVLAHGAEGIGLYRTEFFYLNRGDLPGEEEQYAAYRSVAEKVVPNSVVIRTLDLGGDKFLSQLDVPHELNPFLGWRAIRFCLERPDIFMVQLRALLRASAHGNIKIMFPMISGLGELQRALLVLEEVKEQLRQEKIPFNEEVEVGAMIETPSAAMTADILAREVDFFSIGTNDLIQYALAVDRVNEKIAYLYEPAHPAVLRLVKGIIDAGHKEGIWVGMCGEMAGEPIFAPILLGLGLDGFSMSAVGVPEIKRVIRSVSLRAMQQLVEEIFSLNTGAEIEVFVHREMRKVLPNVFF